MKRALTMAELQLVKEELINNGYKPELVDMMQPENTYINGITVYETTDKPDGRYFRYIEDDVVNESGYAYIFEHPYFKIFEGLRFGSRLIAVYYADRYLVMPVNGRTFTLAGTIDEEKARSVDISKCVMLPSPLLLRLEKNEPRPIEPADVREITEAVKTYAKYKTAGGIGTAALIVLDIIVVGLLYIFSAAALMDSGVLGSMPAFIIYTAFALALLILGIVGAVKFFKNIYLRNILKKKYIRKVMFADRESMLPISANISTEIGVYEWVYGSIRYSRYTVGVGTMFLSDDVHYGDIAYLLTKGKNIKDPTDAVVIFQNAELRDRTGV